jgi:3-dehydroquinate synthase
VDSSVGGKTGIDSPYGKNLIGAFLQPLRVIIDLSCLQTLPKKQLINGLIEAIKMALTNDEKAFKFIEKNLSACLDYDEKTLQKIIQRAVQIKANVVAQDEKEKKGPRMILNFGHTIGHALEKITDYKILHGYGVAYGILWESKIAELQGVLSKENYQRIENLFARLNIFPQDLKKYSLTKILHATRQDKKVKSGKVRYVLIKNIGAVYIEQKNYAHHIDDKIVAQAFRHIIKE